MPFKDLGVFKRYAFLFDLSLCKSVVTKDVHFPFISIIRVIIRIWYLKSMIVFVMYKIR